MEIDVVLQPYDDSSSLKSFLASVTSDSRFTKLVVATAWTKFSGVGRVSRHLQTFRDRGGSVEILSGLSQGGATKQGLQACLEVADITRVILDGGNRTFHPKIYLATGPEHGFLLIGSQNLTAGGLLTNFEAAVTVAVARVEPEFSVVQKVEAYLQRLRDDDGICKILTPDVLAEILTSGAIEIADESRSENRSRPRGRSETSIFGRAQGSLNRVGPFDQQLFSDVFDSISRPNGAATGTPQVSEPPEGAVLDVWSKKLPLADAQRLPTANASGHIALTKSTYNIDQSTYFRDEFFAECDWLPIVGQGQLRERALVEFVVSGLSDVPMTAHLEVDHFPGWDSDQGNRSSTLRWGPELNPVVRGDIDVTGKYLVLRKYSGPKFTLSIEEAPPSLGPASG